MPSEDFYHLIDDTRTIRLDETDRSRAIRLYKVGTLTWSLQVRGPNTTVDGRDGKSGIAAIAILTREDMAALRDAIDRALEAL